MKRVLIAAALSSLAGLLGACSSGGSDTVPGGNTGPLAIEIVAAAPSSGGSPLRTTLTANISGGAAPFFYAFDFENDGAFDSFINSSSNRTLSVSHEYQLRLEDAAAGVSTYNAILRVTDSKGAVVTSDPVVVTVTGASTFAIDPDPTRTFAFSEEQDNEGNYVFRNGESVFFRVGLLNDTAQPISYQWDFNNDGVVDSTISNPQFVYNNNDPVIQTFVAQLRVVDNSGAEDFFSFTVPVLGEGAVQPPRQDFDIILTSTPATGSENTITLRFNPAAGPGDSIPGEPELELSAGVSSASPGRPPYEFYWDFENDGKIDSQVQSPTIPYFDITRGVAFNPYAHSQNEKEFTLRLLVIDSAGQREELLRTIRVINMQNRPPDTIDLTVTYDADGSGNPFAEVSGSADRIDVPVTINATGSTGFFEYRIDVNGDGTGDVPSGGGFATLAGGSQTVTITFGRFDNDANAGTPDAADWPVPGYYPARVTVRSLSGPGGTQQDVLTEQIPLSFVELGLTETDVDFDLSTPTVIDGVFPAVQDHAMVGFSDVNPGGANTNTLASRGVIVMGGARGGTALRDVFRITQTFNPPAQPGEREEQAGEVIGLALTPMNVARRGLTAEILGDPGATDTDTSSAVFAHFGRNPSAGPLATSEFLPLNNADGSAPWTNYTVELRLPESYPIYDLGSVAALGGGGPLTFFTGGLNQPTINSNALLSGTTFVHDPSVPGFFSLGRDLRIPRYEVATVLVGTDLYCIGGRVAGGQSVKTVEVIDLGVAGARWLDAPSLLEARAGASAEVINGQIYVYGGANFPSDSSTKQLVRSAEVFNPDTGIWSYTVPLPTGRETYDGAAARLPAPGATDAGGSRFNSIWTFGGESDLGTGGQNRESNFLQEFIYFHTVSP